MSGREIEILVWDVLAAVLADDQDGLHELMQPLDRDELDFLLTSVLSLVAAMVMSPMRKAGHSDPRGQALHLVREFAVEASMRHAVRESGE
ncbi:hypothetical protein GCM10022419_008060 [Nonomuraea rosea]|uniref:BetI-type transcriptional repressor C-terminal domain-containing protein n=2 Tax=Nonomuraea rosea TaxID=638574 RepID=A0ABP6VCB1_9ACTN